MPAFDALPAPQPEGPAVPAAGAAQGPQLLIDQFLPCYDFAVVHAQVFRVPPGVCLRAARNLDKHQPRGISLEHIRRDRILQEALATGADPLHLALVFNIDHTNAMACRQRRPQPSQRPSRMVCGRASQVPLGVAVPQWQAAEVWCNGTSQAPERGLGTLVKLRWERGGPWWSAGSG